MTEEYPDVGPGDEDQSLYTERTVVDVPPAGGAQADYAGRDAAGSPPTGDDRVDAAVAGLSRLPGRSAEDRVAILEEVHGRLRDILGELAETPETSEGREQR